MSPAAELAANITFGSVMAILALVGIYQVAIYTARNQVQDLPDALHELEAGATTVFRQPLLINAEELPLDDNTSAGITQPDALHSAAAETATSNQAFAANTAECAA